MNGFINAHLDETLSWPQFPGATSYQVYVWIDGEEQPTEPTSVLVERVPQITLLGPEFSGR